MNNVFVLDGDGDDAPYMLFETWAAREKAKLIRVIDDWLDERAIARDHPARLKVLREASELIDQRFAADQAPYVAIKH